MSSVWGMIFQWGSTIKVSIELAVATRHHRDMTEKLLKAMLNPNKQQIDLNIAKRYTLQGNKMATWCQNVFGKSLWQYGLQWGRGV